MSTNQSSNDPDHTEPVGTPDDSSSAKATPAPDHNEPVGTGKDSKEETKEPGASV